MPRGASATPTMTSRPPSVQPRTMTSASAVYRLNRANVIAWLGLAAIAVYFAVLSHAVGAWPYDEWMVLLLCPH